MEALEAELAQLQFEAASGLLALEGGEALAQQVRQLTRAAHESSLNYCYVYLTTLGLHHLP